MLQRITNLFTEGTCTCRLEFKEYMNFYILQDLFEAVYCINSLTDFIPVRTVKLVKVDEYILA